jgi:hypothetical protein
MNTQRLSLTAFFCADLIYDENDLAEINYPSV